MSTLPETDLFHKAIQHWWVSKKSAAPKKAQGGTRDANLHGKTMDGFAVAIRDFLIGLNVKPEHIFAGGHLTNTPSILPSYFRPSKNWDLVVLANSRFHSAKGDKGEPVLYAATEFKSQDKSIGNNQNNRLEESLGNAPDFWTTYEHDGFLRQLPRPWLGYLFVGKYDPAADNKPVKIKQPHFEAMTSFRTPGSSNLETFDGRPTPNATRSSSNNPSVRDSTTPEPQGTDPGALSGSQSEAGKHRRKDPAEFSSHEWGLNGVTLSNSQFITNFPHTHSSVDSSL